MNVVMKIFQGNKYQDIDEIEQSYAEAADQIKQIFEQLSLEYKPQDSSSDIQFHARKLIKVQDLPTFMSKVEDIVGHDMEPFKDYFNHKFHLRQTLMAVSLEDLNLAFSHHIIYMKYLRDNPIDPQKLEEEKQKAFREDTIIREKRRKEGFFSAYTLENQDPKEAQRIRSLQLICFKVANHKKEIIDLLDRYLETKGFSRPQTLISDDEDEFDSPKFKSSKSKSKVKIPFYKQEPYGYVPISQLVPLLEDFCEIINCKLISFDQYMQGYVPTENDPDCVVKFEKYIYLGLSQEQAKLYKKQSLLRGQDTYLNPNKINAMHTKHVKFIDEGLLHAKKLGSFGFTVDYFLLKIDKFFAKESTVVLIPSDDEYEKYLVQERIKQEELDNTINQLDDFFFMSTEKDINEEFETGSMDNEAQLMKIPTRREGKKGLLELSEGGIKSKVEKKVVQGGLAQKSVKIYKEDDLYRRNLVNSIQKYQRLIKTSNFKSQWQKGEMEKLLNILISQLEDYDKQSQLNGPQANKEEIEQARKRGLLEIFNFYSRQHIPLNKQFDDLKEIMNEVNLGEYLIFCKDFNVPVSKTKITEVYKKSSDSHKPLKIEQFQKSLVKLGSEYVKVKIEETQKKLGELEQDLQQFKVQQLIDEQQQYKPDINSNIQVQQLEVPTISPIEALKNATGFVMTVAQQALKNKYQSNDLQGALPPNIQMQNILAHSNTDKDDANELVSQAQKSTNINSELRVQETRLYDDISIIPPSDSNYDKLESLKQTRDKLKYQIGVYQAMSEDQARDELINFLECADPLKFRKKMKGVQMPFSTHSKSPMALESKDPISIKIDIETKKTQNDQVRKQMQEIKMKKIQERLQTEREAQEKASQDREELAQKYKNINRQKLAQIAAQQITSKVNNMNQINTQKIKQQKKNPSYTFQDFEKMHYSELNRDTIQEESFNPSDILDLNEEFEDEVLKKYQVDDLKKINEVQQILQNNKTLNQKTRRQRNVQDPREQYQTLNNQMPVYQNVINQFRTQTSLPSDQNLVQQTQAPQAQSVIKLTPKFQEQKYPMQQQQMLQQQDNPITMRESNYGGFRGRKRGGQITNQSQLYQEQSKIAPKNFNNQIQDPTVLTAARNILVQDSVSAQNRANSSLQQMKDVSPTSANNQRSINLKSKLFKPNLNKSNESVSQNNRYSNVLNNSQQRRLNESMIRNYQNQQKSPQPINQFQPVNQSVVIKGRRNIGQSTAALNQSLAGLNMNNLTNTIDNRIPSLSPVNMLGMNTALSNGGLYSAKNANLNINLNDSLQSLGLSNGRIPIMAGGNASMRGQSNQKDQMINRAQQLNQIIKQNQERERNLNNILKMQDNNMRRGLNAARKL